MRILIWRIATKKEEDTEACFYNSMEWYEAGIKWNLCCSVAEDAPKPVIVVQNDVLTDVFDANGLFLVSKRLKDLLNCFPIHAESIVCDVKYESGKSIEDAYYFYNILDSVECFDFEKSVYTMTSHGAYGVEVLVLRNECAEGHHLFMIGQPPSETHNPKAVRGIFRCASEELATAVIEGGFTGVQFCLPKDFRSYPAEAVAWDPRSE